MNNKVYTPEELYRSAKGVPPDLIVLLGALDYRSVGSVGYPDPFTLENDTGPDDANHDMQGMVAAAITGRGLRNAGSRLPHPAHIYDIATTTLKALGLTPPPEMQGEPLGQD
jgi:predicted AlkP superfamily phosphohydrolase/phosphomutase